LWNTAVPIGDPLAELARRYLTLTRHLDLDRLGLPGDASHALRFHPRCHFEGAHLPCLQACYTDIATGTFAGVIRTALTADARKIKRLTLGCWPTPRAVMLWPAACELTIAEGVKTALGAVAISAVASPVWALGPRNSIAGFPLLPAVNALNILVDHDAEVSDGTKTCARRWNSAGRRVRLLRTDLVKDFNDLR
jgi:hypothetical protein